MSVRAAGLPEGWTRTTLAAVLTGPRDLTYGIVQPGVHDPEGVPIVRVTDIRNGRVAVDSPMRVEAGVAAPFQRSQLQGGELLITLVGTVGECAVAPKLLRGWNTARAVGVARVRPDIGADWVAICLRSREAQEKIAARVNTTVQTTLNLRDVRELPIVLPQAAELHRIRTLVAALDDRIDANRRICVTSWALCSAMYANLTSSGALRPLKEILDLAYGKALPASKRKTGDVVVYGSGGVTGSHEQALLRGPAVIVGRKGTVGGVYWSPGDCWPIDTTFYAVPLTGWSMIYCFFTLLAADLPAMNSDSAVPGLNRTAALARLVVAVQPAAASSWSSDAEALVARAAVAEEECCRLAELRDALLPELLSGRIRVPEAGEAIESVLA